MRIYLDLCIYNRPFDDQSHPRVLMETMGLLVLFLVVQAGDIKTYNSFVLEYENSKNPNPENRRIIADMLSEAASYIKYAPAIELRAIEFEQDGIKHFDALHLACAEHVNADCFVTCDNQLLKRANSLDNLKTKVTSLLEFMTLEVFNAEFGYLST